MNLPKSPLAVMDGERNKCQTSSVRGRDSLRRSLLGCAEKVDDDFSDIVEVQESGWGGMGWDGGGARHGLSH